MRRIVLVVLGNDLGPNNPDCLVVLCGAVATENTDDITHILFRKGSTGDAESQHLSDPTIPESRLSRRDFCCRRSLSLIAIPFATSFSRVSYL
jgi:hypothetical protein